MATLPLSPLLFFVTISSHLASSTAASAHYLEAACNVTRHRALCMRSLESFSHSAAWKQKNPSWWARGAVAVTLTEANDIGRYLAKMKHGGRTRGGRAGRAMADCVECFGDAVAELRSSLGELRRLERGTFEYQMSNVETWVSAALTNQDTCLDGFGGYKGKEVGEVKAKVLNATYLTSNALALVNNLASSGAWRN
ncbi:pectinesterase inhibitor 6-like [Phoenix dactylifera]|uniref:Pectinesterase inhibitor 6-like n=1 Tax=Phoenix dactylifera TaxID=42345 RepID=A0A8B7BT79_PHODC|nr:pectinesterase inhibitor 6-like [Phoenix dactylifera]